MTAPTKNDTRRKAARAALRAFVSVKDGIEYPGTPRQEDVIDLLTDLRHFCTGGCCSFDDAVRISEYHYKEEK